VACGGTVYELSADRTVGEIVDEMLATRDASSRPRDHAGGTLADADSAVVYARDRVVRADPATGVCKRMEYVEIRRELTLASIGLYIRDERGAYGLYNGSASSSLPPPPPRIGPLLPMAMEPHDAAVVGAGEPACAAIDVQFVSLDNAVQHSCSTVPAPAPAPAPSPALPVWRRRIRYKFDANMTGNDALELLCGRGKLPPSAAISFCGKDLAASDVLFSGEFVARVPAASASDLESPIVCLFHAIATGHSEKVRTLVGAAGGPASCHVGAATALHFACSQTSGYGVQATVGELLASGARMDALDQFGRTAFHACAINGCRPAASELVKFRGRVLLLGRGARSDRLAVAEASADVAADFVVMTIPGPAYRRESGSAESAATAAASAPLAPPEADYTEPGSPVRALLESATWSVMPTPSGSSAVEAAAPWLNLFGEFTHVAWWGSTAVQQYYGAYAEHVSEGCAGPMSACSGASAYVRLAYSGLSRGTQIAPAAASTAQVGSAEAPEQTANVLPEFASSVGASVSRTIYAIVSWIAGTRR
jgi:hypothetical protein